MRDVLYIDGDLGRQNGIRRALAAMGLSAQPAATFAEAALLNSPGAYRLIAMYLDNANSHEGPAFCSLVRSRNPLLAILVLMDEPWLWLEEQLFDSGASDVIVGAQTRPDMIASRIKVRLAKRPLSIRSGAVTLGDAVINFDRCEVKRADVAHPLSGVLLDLLWYLVCSAGRVVSRQELCESPIWAHSVCTPPGEGGKTFDIHISRLRKLIEDNPHKPRLIQSVRGIGWKLMAEPVWHEANPSRVSS